MTDPIAAIQERHRLTSAHKCVCGWEGDSAVTHVIDALGIEQIGTRESVHSTCWRQGRYVGSEPVYTIRGERG